MGPTTHPRYAHENSPSEIHVRCPKCKGKALARRAPLPILPIGKQPPPSGPRWQLTCLECMHRADKLEFEDLTEPWYQISARGETLFAWNRDHLVMLGRFLGGESVEGDPYEDYVAYVRRTWLKVREDLAKAIQRRLVEEDD